MREWRYSSTILNSVLGGEVQAQVALHPERERERERLSPCKRYTEGWVSFRADLDAVRKRKIITPPWNRIPAHPVIY
jgi:hypothetical protein